jgi:hypothetical protein
MVRITKHEGRIEMKRAPKPYRKQTQEKKNDNEFELDQLRYLGDIIEPGQKK